MDALIWAVVILIVFVVLIILLARFYERATNEMSLVKTGVGGRKVVIDGGTLVVPYFHEVARVNMQTLRLDVQRKGDGSLITKDRMRVDVGAEFYASVIPNEDAIARAAQALGKRTYQPDQLRELIGGMMVDALRSVAAKMTMDELHENRSAFVKDVRDSLKDVLSRYGLQLDSVSLTALDQTPFSTLDDNNAFNAVGMRKLAEVIAKSKKERAEIDADSRVSVRRAAVDAAQKMMEIDLEERRSEIAQQQEIETLMAAQVAEVAERKADSERSVAKARIDMEQSIQAADIEKDRALEIAEQDRQISIAAKSQDGSRAEAEASLARVEAVKAEEAVRSARELADAERRKEIAVISASAEAQATAARNKIAAESEKLTAKNRAEAKREEIEALKFAKLADVEVAQAQIKAENSRSTANAALTIEQQRLEAMPKIVAEMVKPAEKIKGIHINHVSGLGSGNSNREGSEKPPVNQALDSIMDMAVQLPVLKKLGEAIGMNFEDGFGDILNDKKDKKPDADR